MKNPMRIAAFGDSNMRGWRSGLNNHETYRALLEVDLCRRGIPCVLMDASQPGNTVLGGHQRFERDVLAMQPDAVLIGFGTNDAAPSAEREGPRVSLQTFREVHEYWFNALRKRGIPFLLLSCPPLATSDAKERNPVLCQYASCTRELAAAWNIPLCDLWQALVYREQGGCDLSKLFLDGMHFNSLGARLVADQLLKTEEKSAFFRSALESRRGGE